MYYARAKHDYATAMKALEKFDAIQQDLWNNVPHLIGKKSKDYCKRFWRGTIEQGYANTTGGNEMVAGLDDEWEFQIDPEQVGEAVGWWNPTYKGGSWQKIKTSTSTWSDQGLRYYKGLAWYRQNLLQ